MKQPKFLKRFKYRSARKKLIPHIKTENPIIKGEVDAYIPWAKDPGVLRFVL